MGGAIGTSHPKQGSETHSHSWNNKIPRINSYEGVIFHVDIVDNKFFGDIASATTKRLMCECLVEQHIYSKQEIARAKLSHR